MTELYPKLGSKLDPQLKYDLHEIGFTEFEHLRKEKRDGRVRLTWTCPVAEYNIWFKVVLVLESGQLYIDLLTNPLGQYFDKADINGLIAYINKFIRKLN